MTASYMRFQKQPLEVFCKKRCIRNFVKFTGKHLRHILFFNKVAGACNVIKKETLAQVFSCEFCKISLSTFFTEHLRRLLLFFGNRPVKIFNLIHVSKMKLEIIQTVSNQGNLVTKLVLKSLYRNL